MDDLEQFTLISTSPPEARPSYSQTPWGDYQKHSNAAIKSSVLTIANSLRERHPNFTLTVAQPYQCDLLGFANAGFALSERDSSTGLGLHSYVPPASQLEGTPGTLVERIFFARYIYTWHNYEFTLYVADGYREGYMGSQLYTFLLCKFDGKNEAASESAVIDALILAASQWTLELHEEIWIFDQLRWQKSSELYRAVQDSSWDDVILDEEMKNTVKQDVEGFFDEKESYKEFAVPWKRGIIFWGPPGNGKTISIKAMMKTLSNRAEPVGSLYVKSFTSYNPEYAIRTVFTKAREVAPCLLIFEDVDSLVTPATRSYFLNEVDGLEKNYGVLMLASTNHLDRLDPGIAKRPSRFDRKYLFPLPSMDERVQYCEYWRSKLKSNSKIEFPERLAVAIAEITDMFSFAYMQEAFVAALLALRHNRNAMQSRDLGRWHDELDKLPLWREMKKQIKNLRDELDAGRLAVGQRVHVGNSDRNGHLAG